MDGFRIDRLPDGGFVVTRLQEDGRAPCVLASSEIDDALGYVKEKLEPEKPAKPRLADSPIMRGEGVKLPPVERCSICGSKVIGADCLICGSAVRPAADRRGDFLFGA